MAKTKIGGITVEIGADTSDLSKKLKDVNSESKKTTQELKSIDQALKQAPNSLELWRQKQEALAKSVENSKKKLEALVSEQENLKKGLENGTVTEDAYKAYQREIEITKGQIESAEKALDDFTNSSNKAGDSVKQTGKDIEDSGKKAESSSEGFTVLKGAVAQLAADGFEKLMSSAKEAWEEIDEGYDTIIEKTGATDAQLEEMQRTADKVFTSIPVEMSDTGAAVGEINTRFAATGDELESLTAYFLKYAEVNDTQVAGSVRNVAGIMKAFQEDTKNTTSVLDVLTDVGQRTGKDLNSLESELLSNSATFKELGLDIRQSAELLGQFEANGIDTSTALAGLKKAQQEATAEGKTMTDALGDTMERIKGAKDETEALQIATDLFGKKGAATMTQAIREQRFSLDDLVAGYGGMRAVVSDTFDATQDAPDKAKVALNNLKLELAQLGEAVLPKVEKFVSKGVDDLPKIIKFGEEMLPLIKGVGAAYATWKIASTAVKGAEAVKGLATAVKGAEGATSLLNKTMLANPAVAVTAAVVGLTVALGALYKAEKDELDIEGHIAKQYENEYKAIQDTREEVNKLKDDYNSRAMDIENESKRTEGLWKELDELADASGRVKDADKKRAEYILGELNSALGTEYSMTDNQIEGYKNLASEIDNVIAKKKAEALLDQYMAMNSAMISQNTAAQQRYEQYSAAYQEASDAETQAMRTFRATTQNMDITPQEYINTYKVAGVGTKEGYDAAVAYQEAKEHTKNTADLMQQARADFNSSLDYIHKLDDAERAFSEERYNDVKDILYSEKNANKEILNDTKSSLEERQKAYDDSLKKIYSDMQLYSQNWRQAEADAIMQEMGEVVEAGKLAGIDADEAFTKEFKDGVQKMLDKGFDISELAKWAKDSGVDIAEVFGDKYMNYIQKQLDKGYDVHDLLVWAFNTGGQMSQEQWAQYIEIWKANMRTTFGEGGGIDIAGMVSWAQRTGRTLGDITGENFSTAFSEWTQDLYKNNDLINKYSINSESDARGWREYFNAHKNDPNDEAVNYFKSIGWYASGGFIGIGHEGIVAEAGPELLQVMNGGVKVTPLSRSATNTPVGAGGDTINNYYYNSVQATVGSRYDVYKMAEDLSTGEKRINQGKGRQA